MLAQTELNQALNNEEELWREKARVKWIFQGDINIAFFHRLTKVRYASKSMSILKQGNDIIDDPRDIAQHAISYFENLYVVPNNCLPNDLISRVVPATVTQMDNAFLTSLPSNDEIKKAVFAINNEGDPGPDGFGGCFY